MPAGSPYQTVQLNIAGPSYRSRSLPISAQRSLNMYPEVPQGDSISPVVMHSWVGLKGVNYQFEDPEISACYVFKGVFYAVCDVELRKYNYELSAYTAVGSIDRAPNARVSISDNGQVMLLVAGASAWESDGITLSVVPSATNKPTKVQFLNERFYINGDDGGVSVSDVLSTNFDSGNVFYGRSTPELTVTHHIFNQIIYLFDSSSIEPWSDVGEGAPPTARINQGIIEDVGCASVHGIASTNSAMYFIGSDAHAYRVKGFAAEDITNSVISHHFRSLDVIACELDVVSINGDKFIIFQFLNDSEVWVFSENSGQWFEVGNDDGTRYQMSSPVFYLSRWYCGDRLSGNIYEMVTDFILNGFKLGRRERVFTTISGEDFGQSGAMIEMSKLRLSIETGTASIAASLQNPKILLIPSFDGGFTWSKPIILEIGRQGDFAKPIEVHMMQQFRRAVFKISMTDLMGNSIDEGGNLTGSNALTLFSASIDLRVVPY